MIDIIDLLQLGVLTFIALRLRPFVERSESEKPNSRERAIAKVTFCKSISFRGDGKHRERFHSEPSCPKYNTDKTREQLIAERPDVSYSINNHAVEASRG